MNFEIDDILIKDKFSKEDIIKLLSVEDDKQMQKIFDKAYKMKLKHIGAKSYYRGLIEFSNICIKNCFYCGIRKDSKINKYIIGEKQILEMATWAYENNYGSVTLQAGERTDKEFTDFCTKMIKEIKKLSNNELGITLALGEQTEEVYKKWKEAGGDRYLLRIETSDKELYKQLHPNDDLHSFDKRVDCIHVLRKVGFQVGTGIMVGLPNQTIESLANDILFFERMDIDMLGMGPYVVEKTTPTGKYVIDQMLNTEEEIQKRFYKALKVLAVSRLHLKDVNIAASTAMQALHPQGRELALKSGANILMPVITLKQYKESYQLYDFKQNVAEDLGHYKKVMNKHVETIGEIVGFGEWGDSPHYKKRVKK